MPSLAKIGEVGWRNRANVEALITSIAILRWNEDKGSYPDDLNDLVEGGYLKTVPMDPFSDGPLKYFKDDDGFRLYSASVNFVDDGGKVITSDDGSIKQWTDEGDAVFWPVK